MLHSGFNAFTKIGISAASDIGTRLKKLTSATLGCKTP